MDERHERFKSQVAFEKALKSYEETTMTKFVVARKTKKFGLDDPTPENKNLMWDLKSCPYDGVPFMVCGSKTFACHQGKDQHKKGKERRKQQLLDDQSDHNFQKGRRLLQQTKKLDCPAGVSVTHVIRFPEYKIPADVSNVAKMRLMRSKQLRLDLGRKTPVETEQQYVVCFPDIMEHKNHPVVGEAAEVREAVDASVVSYIENRRDKARRECGSLQREITEYTYQLSDIPFLDSVKSRLTDILEDVRRHAPHDEALLLVATPPPAKKGRYLALKSHRKSHPYTGRHGKNAEVMRQCFKPQTGFQPQPGP